MEATRNALSLSELEVGSVVPFPTDVQKLVEMNLIISFCLSIASCCHGNKVKEHTKCIKFCHCDIRHMYNVTIRACIEDGTKCFPQSVCEADC